MASTGNIPIFADTDPLHLVLLSFQIVMPMGWLLPVLIRTVLVALALFLVGGFWSAVSSR